MPQLPSDRRNCVALDPLRQLVEGIKDNPFINKLLAIERREDLYPYIEFMYLREDASVAMPNYTTKQINFCRITTRVKHNDSTNF